MSFFERIPRVWALWYFATAAFFAGLILASWDKSEIDMVTRGIMLFVVVFAFGQGIFITNNKS